MRFSSEVGADFLEDIDEARRDFHAVGDGKTQPHRLHRLMIGVLSENNHLHVLSVGQSKALEHVFFWRINLRALGISRPKKIRKIRKILLSGFSREKLSPAVFGEGKKTSVRKAVGLLPNLPVDIFEFPLGFFVNISDFPSGFPVDIFGFLPFFFVSRFDSFFRSLFVLLVGRTSDSLFGLVGFIRISVRIPRKIEKARLLVSVPETLPKPVFSFGVEAVVFLPVIHNRVPSVFLRE